MKPRSASELERPASMSDPVRLARYLFSLDTVLGIFSIGGAALFGATYSSHGFWFSVLAIFLPSSALWALFCYGAYKGLTSPNAFTRLLFWLFVVGHVFAIPVGTAISGACIWLWRRLSAQADIGGDTIAAPQPPTADDPDSRPRR